MTAPNARRYGALATPFRLGMAVLALAALPTRAAAQVDIDCNKPSAELDGAFDAALPGDARPDVLPRLPSSRWGDHPAVTVQRLARRAGYNYAVAYYPHPAWLWLRSHPVDAQTAQGNLAAAAAAQAKPAAAPP